MPSTAFMWKGPFIGSEDGPRGVHPQRWVRKPDFDEFQRWQMLAGAAFDRDALA